MTGYIHPSAPISPQHPHHDPLRMCPLPPAPPVTSPRPPPLHEVSAIIAPSLRVPPGGGQQDNSGAGSQLHLTNLYSATVPSPLSPPSPLPPSLGVGGWGRGTPVRWWAAQPAAPPARARAARWQPATRASPPPAPPTCRWPGPARGAGW